MKKLYFGLTLIGYLVLLGLCSSKTTKVEEDFAIANSDYIELSKREEKVMRGLDSSVKYATGLSKYDDFKTSYFDCLTYNFGMNYKGSCGYVAMAELLSYYDTYYNDNIVSNNYDIVSVGNDNNMINRRNSPGVLKDVIVSDNNDARLGYSMSALEYYNSITALQNVSLHAKLITIGASLGYYDFSDDYNPCGTNFDSRKKVLENYLDENSIDYDLVEYNGESNASKSTNVRKFTINQIKNGNPVLLSISGNYGGHVVVAYDYDELSDSIYCHMGWSANETHVTPESQGFYRYKTATVISFNGEHIHSNNYGITIKNNKKVFTRYYCYDSDDIILYTKKYDRYIQYNNLKHQKISSSGIITYEPHMINSCDSNNRYANCILCGALVDMHDGPFITFNVINNYLEYNCYEKKEYED